MINSVMGKVEIKSAAIIGRNKEKRLRKEIEIWPPPKRYLLKRLKSYRQYAHKGGGENRAQKLMQKYHPSVWVYRQTADKQGQIHYRQGQADKADRRIYWKPLIQHNKVQDVLLQINTGKEEVKGGVNPEEA